MLIGMSHTCFVFSSPKEEGVVDMDEVVVMEVLVIPPPALED
jgi:hypothetical protein